MKAKFTIKEIAKEAGVSVSTVSRVLNNHPSVKPEKRKLVQEIIDRENFQPSMLARGMVSNKTGNIAVIVPDINNPYFTDLVAQIDSACRTASYSLLLFNTSTAGSQKLPQTTLAEEQTFQTIIEKQVDGVIILGGEIDKVSPDNHYIEALHRLAKKMPLVIVGQENHQVKSTFLPRSLQQGTAMALQHLLALGYEHIGFIGGEPGIKITEERINAYRETLSLYRSVKEEWIILSDFYAINGYESMQQLLQQDALPQALLTINDNVALGAIRALNDAGLRCPEDIALVSCDAFSGSEFLTPRLTSINQNNAMLGAEAVRIVLKKIDEQPLEQLPTHLPQLLIRESCGVELRKK